MLSIQQSATRQAPGITPLALATVCDGLRLATGGNVVHARASTPSAYTKP
ncbi:hypothetical protein [Gulbenkiania mobilis]|nr:hypothetical protein [Gulbenkiania mobilis]